MVIIYNKKYIYESMLLFSLLLLIGIYGKNVDISITKLVLVEVMTNC